MFIDDFLHRAQADYNQLQAKIIWSKILRRVGRVMLWGSLCAVFSTGFCVFGYLANTTPDTFVMIFSGIICVICFIMAATTLVAAIDKDFHR